MGSAPLPAPAAPPAELTGLTIDPSPIVLRGDNRRQHLIVSGRTRSGQLIDVTHECELTVHQPGVARAVGPVVEGVADGTAELTVSVGALESRVPIRVSQFAGHTPIHFAIDVVPLFSKLGCNSAGCHGKASGQNGFRLSVFGFDPGADYDALVREARGRRVFPVSPRGSLLLLKPTGQLAHGGGRRLEVGSPDYNLLLHWLEQGMPFGRADAPHPVALRVSPASRVLTSGATQQILATAVFSDGTTRDVTDSATYTSNALIAVEATGAVRIGETAGRSGGDRQLHGPCRRSPRPGPAPMGRILPPLPANNRIDELVWSKLRIMGIVPSDWQMRRFCSGFTRPALALPTPEEVRAFLADARPTNAPVWSDCSKRGIRRLLGVEMGRHPAG